MSCTRSQFVAQMQSWVGLKESDGSHKKIIDIYNSIKPLPVGYRLTYTDPWCAGTVSAAAQALGATDIVPAECGCDRMIEKAKEMGIWVEADNYVPLPGDILLYDWDDNGKGDNQGNSDHVGGVEKISGNTMTIIEGNYRNAVGRRTLEVNDRYIRGYIVPKFDADTTAEQAPEVKAIEFEVGMQYLSAGDTGEDVRALQILLNGRGYDCGQADGIFGTKTNAAVRNCQKTNGLEMDGIAGPDTMSCLLGVKT